MAFTKSSPQTYIKFIAGQILLVYSVLT